MKAPSGNQVGGKGDEKMTCPFIGVCTKKVNFKYFRDICMSSFESDYEECDFYKMYAEDSFTPSQWKNMLKRG